MAKGWITEKPSWQRPKGKALDEYPVYQSWTYRRWAWEFLRRNEAFIAACDAVPEHDLEKQAEIAATFKLKRFRHYGWDFKGTKALQPRFLPCDVSYWTFKGVEKVHRPDLEMQAGQVFVRFDLSQAIQDSGAIDAQLRKTRRILTRRFEEYIESIGAPLPKAHKPRKDEYIRLIRLLDLLDSDGRKVSPTLRASALKAVNLNDRASARMTASELLTKYRYQIAAARRYANSDYQFIAAHPDATLKKSVA